MDNIILVTFDNDNDAYKIYDQLKEQSRDLDYNVRDLAVITRKDGRIDIPAGYNSGSDFGDDTTYGGLLGALIGFLGGPIGVLIGAAVGVGAGSIMDSADIDDDDAMLCRVASILQEGQTALAAYVTETDQNEFDSVFSDMNVVIFRWSADVIAAEVEQAKEIHKTLAKEAREQMRK